MEKKKGKKPPFYRFEIPGRHGDDRVLNDIRAKLKEVRAYVERNLGHTVNNRDIIQHLFDVWDLHKQSSPSAAQNLNVVARKENCDQKLLVVAESAFTVAIQTVHKHALVCAKNLKAKKITTRGHTSFVTLSCARNHRYTWPTSPALPNGKRLVDSKIAHAYVTSGLLPNQYDRFTKEASIGTICKDNLFKFTTDHSALINAHGPFVTRARTTLSQLLSRKRFS